MQSAAEAKESPSRGGAREGLKSTSGDVRVLRALTVGREGLSVKDGAEGGSPDAPRSGAPGTPAALLHRNSNNCAEPSTSKGYRLRSKATFYKGQAGHAQEVTVSVTDKGEGVDRDGRAWQLGEDGKTWERMFGGITSAEAKRAYALRVNVEAFTEYYRHDQCGFLTLTAEEADLSPKEFGERFHLMRRHGLKWLKGYVRVTEAQKRGAPHYHLCAATPFDLKPSTFDWEALRGSYEARKAGDLARARELTKQYAQSAAPELREIWAELREVCRAYGLGRSEMLPYRKAAGAVAHYIGKYLEGGLSYRRDEWKGARRVEYDRKESRAWKRCASSFAWVSPGAKAWRIRVAELARAVGAATPADLVRKLGSRWAYHARPSIMMEPEHSWRTLLQYWASEYGGKVDRKARMTVGGNVLIWWPGTDDNVDCASTCTVHSPGGLGDESSPS